MDHRRPPASRRCRNAARIVRRRALTTGNATEASLRQLLKQQTLARCSSTSSRRPEDNRKAQGVIELARVASSGEQALARRPEPRGRRVPCDRASCSPRSCCRRCWRRTATACDPRARPDRAGQGTPPTIDLAELRAARPPDPQAHGRPLAPARRFGRALQDGARRRGIAADRAISSGRCSRSPICCSTTSPTPTRCATGPTSSARTLSEKATELPDEEEIVQRLASSFLQRGGDEPEPIARHIRAALRRRRQGARSDREFRAADRRENREGHGQGDRSAQAATGHAVGRALSRDRQQPRRAEQDLRGNALVARHVDAELWPCSSDGPERRRRGRRAARDPPGQGALCGDERRLVDADPAFVDTGA
jgi:hypothetical protein